MIRLTDELVRQLGGTSAIAKLVHAPVSTVHSWRRKGISASRLAHLKLAAEAAGKTVDWASDQTDPSTSFREPRTKDEMLARLQEWTGIDDRDALIEQALRLLLAKEAGKALIAMGGSQPGFKAPDRERPPF